MTNNTRSRSHGRVSCQLHSRLSGWGDGDGDGGCSKGAIQGTVAGIRKAHM